MLRIALTRRHFATAVSGLALVCIVAGGTGRPAGSGRAPLLRLPLGQVNVSRAPGAQLEAAIIVAPSNPSVIVAGSNDVQPGRLDTRAYTSTDGGQSWVSSHPYRGAGCAIGDPAVAIDRSGRELFSYLIGPCRAEGEENPTSVYVSTRDGPSGGWTSVRVAGPLETGRNDKPTLVWDTWPTSRHLGRAYVAWSRILSRQIAELVVAHSDDGGATWSKPVRVTPPALPSTELFASLAVSPSGDLYVVRIDISHAVFLSRSTDGGARFGATVEVEGSVFFPNVCRLLSVATAIPAQGRRCVTPTPTIVARSATATVVYAEPGADGQDLDVFARTYDAALRPRAEALRVTPPEGETASDQFQPTAALDPNGKLIWVCFYDTRGDPTRNTVRFSCTASSDGIRWRPPVPVASVRSNETGASASPYQYGDYQGLAIGADGVAHPIWTDARDLAGGDEEIYTTTLTAANLDNRAGGLP